MKTISLTFLIFLWLGAGAQARIGETLEECIKRYGEPVQREETKTLIFQKSGISINCGFREGRCVQITYQKIDTKARLNNREVEILRAANGSNWILQGGTNSPYSYMRNEVCECYWNSLTGMLQFETLAELKRKAKEVADAERKLLEGF